jgi:hypothetical protein
MKKISFVILGILILATVSTADAAFTGTELLGRPTNHSVTINVVADTGVDVYFEYGTQSGVYATQTVPTSYPANGPIEVVINGLQDNMRYYYRMVYRETGTTEWIARDEHSFHTQRSFGSTFTFTITSDSHLGAGGGNANLYQQTLLNVLADNPDFHLDLGDTFWMDNINNEAQARQVYLAQRPYLGLIGHSAPIFLATGNHENEEGWNLDDTPSLPLLSVNARKLYYPNPVPDGFYSGNADASLAAINGDHLREDYYAWEWGDALFVVIDPYQYTMIKPYAGSPGGEKNDETVIGDRWDWTLGQQQFNWFKQTLENSTAKFKFVFAHNMVGGSEDYVRGGAGPAHLFEWGGYNLDGSTWGFATERPGWGDDPIHQLMVDNRVSAFFHGHDHEYAKERKNGIIYQLCPQPGDGSYRFGFDLYHESDPYTDVVLPNSGHLRVAVSPSQVTVDYVRAYLPGDGTNGQVAYTYNIEAGSNNNPPAQPTPVAPNDGSVGTSIQPALEVAVSDPDEDTLDVTFYGRQSGAGAAEDFTVIALPDTQVYSGYEPEIYVDQTQWIVDKQDALNIVYVVHEGDIVDMASSVTQWNNANNAMSLLENPVTTGLPNGIPYGVLPGDHDMPTTLYNNYFGINRFNGRSYYGGYYGDNNDNNYGLFSAAGMDFIVINLMYVPGTSILDWADNLLKTYSNRRAIVVSHWIINTDNTWGQEAIFTSLKDNPNLFLMLCGSQHNEGDGEGQRTEIGDNGNIIHILLADYQEDAYGQLRILQFSPQKDEISVKTYSPSVDYYETDADSQFVLAYDMKGPEDFVKLGKASGIASGHSASITWPNLATGTAYEWYVEVSDGSQTAKGPTWSFTTGGSTNNAPTANAGVDQTIEDAGGNGAEDVILNGAASTDTDGTITSYAWSEGGSQIATGATPTVNFGVGIHTVTLKVTDDDGAINSDIVTVEVVPLAATGQFETGVVAVGAGHVTVNLSNTYNNPVVVCSVQYNHNTTPVVARVSKVTSWAFDVRLQNPSDGAVAVENVSYLVVEEGAWVIDGVKIEAQKYLSTVTDQDSSWVGQTQSYLQSYSSPVVLGQVMSENDADWSVFWCQGNTRTNPPSAGALKTGKTVCEDTDVTRANETIGFIVFEAGHGTIKGVEFEAFLGADTIMGAVDSPPYVYNFKNAFASVPRVALVTMEGVDGPNGGWAYLYGPTFATTTNLYLSIDEDQISDSERNHSTEQVGYVVFSPTVINKAPVADDQAVNTNEDAPATITLTASDADGDALSYRIVTYPSHGSLSGTGPHLTYTPNLDYNGPDSFTFKVNDGQVDSNIATASITITAVNDAPVAYDQTVTTQENIAVAISLAASDMDGDLLNYSINTGPSRGTLSGIPPDVTYNPGDGYTGSDSFTFKVNDGMASSNIASVSITVMAVNEPPVADNQAVNTNEDTPVAVTLYADDANGDALTYYVVTSPSHGVLSGTAPDVAYTPNSDYNGPDSFTFKANDGRVDSNIATVSITVNGVNDAPALDAIGNKSVNENGLLTFTILATDPDGDSLTYSALGLPSGASFDAGTRTFSWRPGYTQSGSYPGVHFEVSDGALTDSENITITVNNVNQAPVANNQSVSTNQDTPKAIIFTATDADGDTLTYSIVAPPTHGALSGTTPNMTFTPSSGYSGTDSFTFKANDGMADSNIATVSVTVSALPSNNLALNKLATADSAQTSNAANKGNDGNSSTRWSANDSRRNHWWKVDLGAAYTLTSTKVQFQYARNYRYKIEVSTDNTTWKTVADRTTTTSTAQTREDSFSATPGRYVRITYTGLPSYPTTWASHYEFEVRGN